MAGKGKEGPTMQHSKTARTMGRVVASLASVWSMLVLAGPALAAEKVATVHEYGHDQFSVYLTGDEARYGGDREGRGFARLDLDPENERVCYVITWSRLEGEVTALDLHASPRRGDGPRWISFFNNERFDGYRRTISSCVYSERWRILAVINDPSYYYLTLRTTAHEAGAIRGQLD
ncbi:MAG: CHRD domain-containing protein [Pseudonocardiaceae bacterium]